jgi:glycine/D-amino acid oxidase-like deaminating enzyme/nitrite reductase/ring-hydroxylating ferredoxin subunit
MQSSEPLWISGAKAPRFSRLQEDGLHVEVAVIGGGITGITTALLLKEAGVSVAVLEARQIGSGVTSRTTAHLTEALDTRYHTLVERFGTEATKLVAESSRAAIEQVAALVAAYRLDCDFARLPGYLFATTSEQAAELAEERAVCERLGLRVKAAKLPLPLPAHAALSFEEQAQLQPVAYLFGLCPALLGNGSHVFEETRVISIEDGTPCRIHTDGGATLTARKVVVATHAPLNRVLLQTKLAAYRSYVIAGPARPAPPRGLFWDMADPYHYIRTTMLDGAPHLIVGGEDHKTGAAEEDEHGAFERLEAYAGPLGLSAAGVSHRWSAQVVEPVDGLPFIGRNAGAENVYVATGFSGNGTTFGTLAALILRDACLGRESRYAKLYEATRVEPLASIGTFLSENVDFPLHILTDRVRAPDVTSLDEILTDHGAIARVGGRRLAVFRDARGALHAVSPVCTHLGCHVAFNSTERTWDCPCHGSRFAVDGTVLDGPAVRGLERVPLDDADVEAASGPGTASTGTSRSESANSVSANSESPAARVRSSRRQSSGARGT